MMQQMLKWADDENEHVRRLSSEGCRPRLPWGGALREFKKAPSPILPILEKLKADESLYVRKSVANNLNDIIKDHPQIVLQLAQRWLKADHPHTNWIVKHGVRTLLKRGNKDALALFGLNDSKGIEIQDLSFTQDTPSINDSFRFSFSLHVSSGASPRLVRIEYGVYYVKANGSQSRKVFHITEKELQPKQSYTFDRKQHFKQLTTRKHYPGTHKLVVIINGDELMGKDFELLPAKE